MQKNNIISIFGGWGRSFFTSREQFSFTHTHDAKNGHHINSKMMQKIDIMSKIVV